MVHQKAPDEVILVSKSGWVTVTAAEEKAYCLNGSARDDDDFRSDTKRCSREGFDANVGDGCAVISCNQLGSRGLGDQCNVWCDRQLGFGSREKGTARSKVEDARFHPVVLEWVRLALGCGPGFWRIVVRAGAGKRMGACIVRIEIRF